MYRTDFRGALLLLAVLTIPMVTVSEAHPFPHRLLKRHEITEGRRCYYGLDCPPLYYCNRKLPYSHEHRGYGFGGYGPGGYGLHTERGQSGYVGTHTDHDYGGYRYGICKKEAVSGYEPHDK